MCATAASGNLMWKDTTVMSNICTTKAFAQAFRYGIEKAIDCGEISPRTTKSTMPDFPGGCCEVASDLLGQFLLEKGIQTICMHGEYCLDYCENRYPHTWLETEDGIIIDITADQFKKYYAFSAYDLLPCYVGRDRSLYKLFSENQREEPFAGLENCDGDFYEQNVIPLYDIIRRYADESLV